MTTATAAYEAIRTHIEATRQFADALALIEQSLGYILDDVNAEITAEAVCYVLENLGRADHIKRASRIRIGFDVDGVLTVLPLRMRKYLIDGAFEDTDLIGEYRTTLKASLDNLQADIDKLNDAARLF